jgi:hypothetical protein
MIGPQIDEQLLAGTYQPRRAIQATGGGNGPSDSITRERKRARSVRTLQEHHS